MASHKSSIFLVEAENPIGLLRHLLQVMVKSRSIELDHSFPGVLLQSLGHALHHLFCIFV
jgi:hypothetical protein